MDIFIKVIIILGIITTLCGLLLYVLHKLQLLGRLPLDIVVKKRNFVFFFPLATCILLSILVTIILNLIFKK